MCDPLGLHFHCITVRIWAWTFEWVFLCSSLPIRSHLLNPKKSTFVSLRFLFLLKSGSSLILGPLGESLLQLAWAASTGGEATAPTRGAGAGCSYLECRLWWLLGVWFPCSGFMSWWKLCWRPFSNQASKCLSFSLETNSLELDDSCIRMGGYPYLKWPNLIWFPQIMPSVLVQCKVVWESSPDHLN